jgi:hypothetical protein
MKRFPVPNATAVTTLAQAEACPAEFVAHQTVAQVHTNTQVDAKPVALALQPPPLSANQRVPVQPFFEPLLL